MAVTPPTAARLARGLWIAAVAALALSAGLGSRVAQEHLATRRAWLSESAAVQDPGYEPGRSDALYERSADALDRIDTWATVAGAGLLALVLGLSLRTGRPGPARRPWLRGVAAIAIGLGLYAALVALPGVVRSDLLGPFVETSTRAVAPFAAIAGAAGVWLSRRGGARPTGR